MASEIKTYTPEDAAEALRCTPRCIYNYLRQGKMPGRKIGGRWKILEEDLREFLRTGTPETPRPASCNNLPNRKEA